MEQVISIKNLNKCYDDFRLADVSFDVPEGCIAGFIGLNGNGKTTTIRTMLGLSLKDSGEINLLGKNFDLHEQEIKNKIGVVFDEGYLYESLKMKDMKTIVSQAYSQWDETKYRQLMKRFSLDEEHLIATLSKGMKMKFALVLALSHNAELLIMDEPTSGLDPATRKELMDILKKFMEGGGKGVFYSTHIISDLDKFADVIVCIHNGKILFQQSKDQLLDTYFKVKGNKEYLNETNRKLFIALEETSFGFSGVTKELAALEKEIPDLVQEQIDIETIMLAVIEGRHYCD